MPGVHKALDPTARAGCPQASLLPSIVLAGQRRDWTKKKGKSNFRTEAFRRLTKNTVKRICDFQGKTEKLQL
jgi:hypothetical protein